MSRMHHQTRGWESFIIRLDILTRALVDTTIRLRIFHYSPWYTYARLESLVYQVENLSLFTLIYLGIGIPRLPNRWESFIIHLDILIDAVRAVRLGLRIFHYSPWYTYVQVGLVCVRLRIFHYSPWYTYGWETLHALCVENLSLFTLIYLVRITLSTPNCWESFIIHLDILRSTCRSVRKPLRIFHYSPWYT